MLEEHLRWHYIYIKGRPDYHAMSHPTGLQKLPYRRTLSLIYLRYPSVRRLSSERR